LKQIKKELAQVIIAMASQDYLTLEGGETLVEFIIRNASISDDEIDRFNKNKVKKKRKKRKETEMNQI